MPYEITDTIVAVATPPGQGGVGIVRLSGKRSKAILQFLLHGNTANPREFNPRYMHHGWVHAMQTDGVLEKLDEVLAVYMPGPASFTGEDVAEIHCHGGHAVLLAVVETACRLGARMAEKGEFTYRAFINGKYDLTQAEAVAEMIAAPSRQGVRLAQAKLSGLLGSRVDTLREIIASLRAKAALAIDFPEDEAEAFSGDELLADLETVRQGILGLLAGYKRARYWREGISVLLAGRVNVGKSSLLNALLGRNRAIVSASPGTTRDVIEETLDIGGLCVRIADTAGIRTSADPIEMEGVARALGMADEAVLILLVTDASVPLVPEEKSFLDQHKGRVLVIRNKMDVLSEDVRKHTLKEETCEGCPVAFVSAKSGEGLEALADSIRSTALSLSGASNDDPEQGDIVPNMRQSRLLESALAETEALAMDIEDGVAPDLFSVRLDAVAMYLGDVTGFTATDDILGMIFSNFCIGK